MTLGKLFESINDGTAKIGILGLGYVGLPLALAFSKRYHVIGFDMDKQKISMLKSKKSYVLDVSDEAIKDAINFTPTENYLDLSECDFKIICVPTPLDKNKDPDMTFVNSAATTVGKCLHKGQFVILESTVSPGATRCCVTPIIANQSRIVPEIDFGVAFSPERADPNNKAYNIRNTQKIVGGLNEECREIAASLYQTIVDVPIVKVSTCEVAEASKILENTFRHVNIGLVNELALLFEKMGINIWEVIDAASSKPFGFMPFYPGPGIGGHCIPIDPLYLSHEAKKHGMKIKFIELGDEINERMKLHAVDLVSLALEKVHKNVANSTIAVFGVTYKKDVSDTRESPSITIIDELRNKGATIKIFDPYVSTIRTKSGEFIAESSVKDAFEDADCALFLVDHSMFSTINLNQYKMKNKIIVDCRNIFAQSNVEGFTYYGLGKPLDSNRCSE